MAITQLRILHADHLQPDQPARTRAGAVMLQPGGDYEGLAQQFKRLFNSKPGKQYGRFTDDIGNHPFAAWLRDHLEGKQTFEAFSQRLLTHWQTLLERTGSEADTYLLLVMESLANGDVLYLYGIETETASRFDAALVLDQTEVISQSRLDLALRIELADWRCEKPAAHYLTLLQARGTGLLGEAFASLCGFESSVNVEQETRSFMDAVEAFVQTSPEAAPQIRTRAYDFCKTQHALGEPVALNALSGFLDEAEPTRFQTFAENHQSLPADTVLHPDHRKVKKLVRFSGAGNGMSLSFSSDLVNQAIYYDRERDALTITRLPKAIKQQLEQYLAAQNIITR